MRKAPPAKKAGQATGPRKIDGARMDVASAAEYLGCTVKTLRAHIARGLIPYKRWGGRLTLGSKNELDTFFANLPGVSVQEARRNVEARQ
jgi:excisionase family DNA binding protein